MAIDIPKPIEPQQAPIAELQGQSSGAITVDFQQTHVHVFGEVPIKEERIKAAVERSANLSDAVRGIGAECYLAGYPATMLFYAASGQDVYVLVKRGHVDKVEGPPQYTQFFSGLANGKELTESRMETDRTLASVYADRAAAQGQIVLKPDGPDSVTLIVDPQAPGPKATDLRIDMGNPGNRFYGRDLIDGSIRHSDTYGDEFRFTSIAAFRGFGLERNTNGPYHEQDGSITRDTPIGIFDIDGRFADFRLPLFVTNSSPQVLRQETNNTLWVGGASWLVPVWVNFDHRLTVQLRGDYTDRTSQMRIDQPNQPGDAVTFNNVTNSPGLLGDLGLAGPLPSVTLRNGEQILDEKYPSVELSAAYTQLWHTGNSTWELDLGATGRRGLAAHHAETGAGNLDYWLARPSVQLSYQPGEHLYFVVSGQAQFASFNMPEEQQWVLGGLSNLYAYLPGVTIGDKGAIGRFEAQYRKWEFAGLKFTPHVFAEYGDSKSNNAAINHFPGGVQALADAGGALDVEIFPWLEASGAAATDFYHHDVTAAQRNYYQANYYARVSLKF